MTISFQDLARMYSTTTGDSDIYLNNGAVPGCKTFEQAGYVDSDDINFGVITYDTSTRRPTGTQVGLGHILVDSDNNYRIQRTTTISSISLDSDDTEDGNITLTGLSEVYIPWLSKDVLRIKEADGSPNIYPVNTITVSNGSLSQDSDGQAVITTGGGGGGGGVQYAIYENTGAAETINDGAGLNPATLQLFSDSDNLFSLDSDFNLLCNTSGAYRFDITVYYFTGLGATFAGRNMSTYFDSTTAETNPNSWPASIITVDSNEFEFQIMFGGLMNLANGDYVWFDIENGAGRDVDVSILQVMITKVG